MRRPLFIICVTWLCVSGLTHRADAQWSDMEVWDVFTESDIRNEAAIYFQGNALWSQNRLDSAGVNTAGGFANNGTDADENYGLGGAVGLMWDNCRNRIRPELEVNWHRGYDFVTDSFPGPPQQFYRTSVTDMWSGMGNVWLDLPLHDIMFMYVGGGVGAMGAKMSVDDGIVTANENDTRFVYQLGAGLILPIDDNMEFDVGVRFFDPNVTRLGLTVPNVPNTFGTYKAEQDVYSLMLSVRILLP